MTAPAVQLELPLTPDRKMGSDASRAVGRFNPDGPLGYRARSMPYAPIRATRTEAVGDERRYLAASVGLVDQP